MWIPHHPKRLSLVSTEEKHYVALTDLGVSSLQVPVNNETCKAEPENVLRVGEPKNDPGRPICSNHALSLDCKYLRFDVGHKRESRMLDNILGWLETAALISPNTSGNAANLICN